jgi:hypothetical protein
VEVLTVWRKGGNGPPWLQIGGEARYGEADLARWKEPPSGRFLG